MAGPIGVYGGISLNKNDENVVRAMSLAASVCVQTFVKNGYRVGLVKKFNKLLQKKLNELFDQRNTSKEIYHWENILGVFSCGTLWINIYNLADIMFFFIEFFDPPQKYHFRKCDLMLHFTCSNETWVIF